MSLPHIEKYNLQELTCETSDTKASEKGIKNTRATKSVKKVGVVKDMHTCTDICRGFCVEKKAGEGEDRGICKSFPDLVYAGVFDGCGGSGAKRYPNYDNHTGAYIAAECVSEVFENWFDQYFNKCGFHETHLKDMIINKMKSFEEKYGEKSQILGMISKVFPTTVATAACFRHSERFIVDYLWAGDSRIYLLDEDGLAQLTEDDLGGIDAMKNLTEDGVLTNVVNLTTDFSLHAGQLVLPRDHGIVIAVTDGCFGYLSTPMHFEHLLLETMQQANNVEAWFGNLKESIGRTARDDYTLSIFAVGYGTGKPGIDVFKSYIKSSLKARRDYVYKHFIAGIDEMSYSEKLNLWDMYKSNYYRLICNPDTARQIAPANRRLDP